MFGTVGASDPRDPGASLAPLSNRHHGRTLAALIDAWAKLGAHVPVAIVVSIFDDLLASAIDGDVEAKALSLTDVIVEPSGFARLAPNVALSGTAVALAPLFARALGFGRDEDAIPAHAMGLVARLASDDPLDRPVDAEQLRGWIRDVLGVPATREEVDECFLVLTGVVAPVVDDAPIEQGPRDTMIDPASLAALAPADEIVHDTDIDMLRGRASVAPLDPTGSDDLVPVPPELVTEDEPALAPGALDAPRASTLRAPELHTSAIAGASVVGEDVSLSGLDVVAEPEPLEPTVLPQPATVRAKESSDLPTMRPGEVISDVPAPSRTADGRPVIRHRVEPPSISVSAAPAARRSARPAADDRDILGLPDERAQWRTWAVIAVFAIVLALTWLKIL
ncbi:hypothetical protein L6R52_00335 [Myxococcota bacterium]|nr:hypothetical protein [Myxococcota bacterium]